MAAPAQRSKKTVDLAGPRRTGSRIRRDPPPPPPRKVTPGELRAQEARVMVIGIGLIAMALLVLLVQVSRAAGWSAADYTITVHPGG